MDLGCLPPFFPVCVGWPCLFLLGQMWVCLSTCFNVFSLLVLFPLSILGIFQINMYRGVKAEPLLGFGWQFKVSTFRWHCFCCCGRSEIWQCTDGDPSNHSDQKHCHLFYKIWVMHTFLCPAAALIRGNRNNCTQFSNNLDWLVNKLERLESSSGMLVIILTHLSSSNTALWDTLHFLWLRHHKTIKFPWCQSSSVQ